MASYKGADVIVDYLVREGVPYAVGVCGHGIIGFMDGLYHRQDEIKTISVHHEQAAAHVADAYFRVSGKPLATFTSCGPGSANLTMAVACAMLDSSAIYLVTGNVPTDQFNRGAFQETYRHYQGEFPAVLRPYVKRAYQPLRADMLPFAVKDAFREMMSGRPGPVLLDVPLNVFVEEVETDLPDPGAWRKGLKNDPAASVEAVEEALRLLLRAERPLILAGHGLMAAGGSEELRQLAERLEIPVVSTPMGKGALSETHPLCLGAVGRNGAYQANEAARNCDVLLALGTRFDDRASSAWLPGATYNIPPTRLIQVDIDPQELGRNYPVTLGLLADARQVLRQMRALLESKGGKSSAAPEWRRDIGEWKRVWDAERSPYHASDAVPIRPERLVSDLGKVLPEDAIVLSDVGVHHNWLVQELPIRRPRSFLQAWGFGGMGFGVCGAVGAKLAAPDRPVVSVCGDGGFLMTPHILLTAVEYNLPAVWVVWNNHGYVAIRDLQLGFFGGRTIATSFEIEETKEPFSADFVMLARSMGADGTLVERPSDFAPALESALASGRPTLIEVKVDREIRPRGTGGWELPPLPPSMPSFRPKL
jgi:acetolactate synthase I/II/III large subunit